jgi:hypothetical protein
MSRVRCTECSSLFYEYKTAADRYSTLVNTLKSMARTQVSNSEFQDRLREVTEARFLSQQSRMTLYAHLESHPIQERKPGARAESQPEPQPNVGLASRSSAA